MRFSGSMSFSATATTAQHHSQHISASAISGTQHAASAFGVVSRFKDAACTSGAVSGSACQKQHAAGTCLIATVCGNTQLARAGQPLASALFGSCHCGGQCHFGDMRSAPSCSTWATSGMNFSSNLNDVRFGSIVASTAATTTQHECSLISASDDTRDIKNGNNNAALAAATAAYHK